MLGELEGVGFLGLSQQCTSNSGGFYDQAPSTVSGGGGMLLCLLQLLVTPASLGLWLHPPNLYLHLNMATFLLGLCLSLLLF